LAVAGERAGPRQERLEVGRVAGLLSLCIFLLALRVARLAGSRRSLLARLLEIFGDEELRRGNYALPCFRKREKEDDGDPHRDPSFAQCSYRSAIFASSASPGWKTKR